MVHCRSACNVSCERCLDSDKQIHMCSEEYDETCKIGTGVAPCSALGSCTSLSTS